MSIFDIQKPVAVWDFRINESHYSVDELKEALGKLAKKWTFQLEQGELTDYRHYQGRCSLWKKKRGSELAKLWLGVGELPQYCQPTTKNAMGDDFYVIKEDTRVDGPWSNKDTVQFIPDEFRKTEFRNWQTALLDESKVKNSRQIDIIIDAEGNKGKSWISAHMHLHNKGYDIPPIGDSKDLMSAVMGMLMAKDDHNPGIIFVDIPRAMKQDKLHSLFIALESIKKGRVYDFRYAYKEWWFNSPRLWVFMNQAPDQSYLIAIVTGKQRV